MCSSTFSIIFLVYVCIAVSRRKIRTLSDHEDHLSLLKESEVHSTTFGINRTSILQQLNNFDITKSLPFNIMHTIFEDVAAYHLNLLLHYIIDTKKWVTLNQISHNIKSHQYGYSETDTKPNQINRGQTLDSDFRIKSSGIY